MIEIYGLHPRLVWKRVRVLRRLLALDEKAESDGTGSQLDIYHSSPMNVAGELAGEDRTASSEQWQQWLGIVERENRMHEILAAETFGGSLPEAADRDVASSAMGAPVGQRRLIPKGRLLKALPEPAQPARRLAN